MEAAAKVIRWDSKAGVAREKSPVSIDPVSGNGGLSLHVEALEQIVLMIPDEQLDALGTLFAASPLRKAMTFEGYLVVKGYGYPAH
jgi:hypothetical protein